MCKDEPHELQPESCVNCGHSKATRLLTCAGFDCPDEHYELLECNQCHLIRTHPRLSAEQLRAYYTADYYGDGRAKFVKPIESLVVWNNRERADEMIRLIDAPSGTRLRILDVGCGRGAFLRALVRKGHAGVGLEIPGFEFPDVPESIQFLHGAAETVTFDKDSFDGVSIWHVLEHTRNPALTMQRIAEILRPGGVAVIAVPNFGSLQARIFGKYWFHLDMPRHLYHFKKEVLLNLLERNGLRPVKISSRSLEQNLFGFMQSALNALFRNSPNLLYSLLRKQALPRKKKGSGWTSFALSLLLLFPAWLESAFSCASGKGGTLIIYARKDP